VSLYKFEGKRPLIASSAFVHPEAKIIGGVLIGESCYIGPGAVLRGDWGNIVIGAGSNVQENCVIHAAPDVTVDLGPAKSHRAWRYFTRMQTGRTCFSRHGRDY